VPPLRQRIEDIPSLANRFLNLAVSKLNLPLPQFTKANMMELQNYDWPGNVRELQNVIEHAVITSRSGKLAFNLTNSNGRRGKAERRRVSDAEQPVLTDEEMKLRDRENILNALNQCGWKITGAGGAAEILAMKPTTLHSKIKKLGLKKAG
jgi:DNA-binding NtrC family response regulator